MSRLGKIKLILITLLILFILFKIIGLVIGVSFGIIRLVFRYWYITLPLFVLLYYYGNRKRRITGNRKNFEGKDEIIVELKKDDQ